MRHVTRMDTLICSYEWCTPLRPTPCRVSLVFELNCAIQEPFVIISRAPLVHNNPWKDFPHETDRYCDQMGAHFARKDHTARPQGRYSALAVLTRDLHEWLPDIQQPETISACSGCRAGLGHISEWLVGQGHRRHHAVTSHKRWNCRFLHVAHHRDNASPLTYPAVPNASILQLRWLHRHA